MPKMRRKKKTSISSDDGGGSDGETGHKRKSTGHGKRRSSKKDIEVQYEDNLLTVKSKKSEKVDKTDEDGNIIHRGISQRFFSKSFTIATDVEVKGAELKDGLLTVALERIIPEAKKAKTIEIK